MNKLTILVLLFFLFKVNLTTAQKYYYFLTSNDLDTISNYSLKLYDHTNTKTYLPNKNNSVTVDLEKINKADSIVLHFDYWYKEKIQKKKFNKNTIYLNKQLYLDEVVIKKETKTIGTFNKNFRGIKSNYGIGNLISFNLEQAKKIESFNILIFKNKVENSVFIPVLFMADSIDDPNKIHLYPKGKSFVLHEKFKKKWVNIPIKKYSSKMKSKIFAGRIAENSNIVFGVARAKKNTFLDCYLGNSKNVKKIWQKYIYREEDFYTLAIKIKIVK
ncbi:hypothetical protein [uncultured Mesonia sp.]|uniref:hypothetical protein n=1 Tax=uncultured Mesonia sp. TaxID=399731 RepID=UPI00374F6E9A